LPLSISSAARIGSGSSATVPPSDDSSCSCGRRGARARRSRVSNWTDPEGTPDAAPKITLPNEPPSWLSRKRAI